MPSQIAAAAAQSSCVVSKYDAVCVAEALMPCANSMAPSKASKSGGGACRRPQNESLVPVVVRRQPEGIRVRGLSVAESQVVLAVKVLPLRWRYYTHPPGTNYQYGPRRRASSLGRFADEKERLRVHAVPQ